jgi:hypothetical protein
MGRPRCGRFGETLNPLFAHPSVAPLIEATLAYPEAPAAQPWRMTLAVRAGANDWLWAQVHGPQAQPGAHGGQLLARRSRDRSRSPGSRGRSHGRSRSRSRGRRAGAGAPGEGQAARGGGGGPGGAPPAARAADGGPLSASELLQYARACLDMGVEVERVVAFRCRIVARLQEVRHLGRACPRPPRLVPLLPSCPPPPHPAALPGATAPWPSPACSSHNAQPDRNVDAPHPIHPSGWSTHHGASTHPPMASHPWHSTHGIHPSTHPPIHPPAAASLARRPPPAAGGAPPW